MLSAARRVKEAALVVCQVTLAGSLLVFGLVCLLMLTLFTTAAAEEGLAARNLGLLGLAWVMTLYQWLIWRRLWEFLRESWTCPGNSSP